MNNCGRKSTRKRAFSLEAWRFSPGRRENDPGLWSGGSFRGFLAAYRVSSPPTHPIFSGFCVAKPAIGGADETLPAAPQAFCCDSFRGGGRTAQVLAGGASIRPGPPLPYLRKEKTPKPLRKDVAPAFARLPASVPEASSRKGEENWRKCGDLQEKYIFMLLIFSDMVK